MALLHVISGTESLYPISTSTHKLLNMNVVIAGRRRAVTLALLLFLALDSWKNKRESKINYTLQLFEKVVIKEIALIKVTLHSFASDKPSDLRR